MIDRITADNYSRFEDMVYWREHGCERAPTCDPVPPRILAELANPNLYLYAAEAEGRYVGWISLCYIPKVGKWQGRGHVYVDELWVQPGYRRRGIAKALLGKADEMAVALEASGVRLYVNVQNPAARAVYMQCGYQGDERAWFMEKTPGADVNKL